MQGGKGVLFMKKLLNNLPFRLLLGIVIGAGEAALVVGFIIYFLKSWGLSVLSV